MVVLLPPFLFPIRHSQTSLLSGAIAGVMVDVSMYPIDTIKTRQALAQSSILSHVHFYCSTTLRTRPFFTQPNPTAYIPAHANTPHCYTHDGMRNTIWRARSLHARSLFANHLPTHWTELSQLTRLLLFHSNVLHPVQHQNIGFYSRLQSPEGFVKAGGELFTASVHHAIGPSILYFWSNIYCLIIRCKVNRI